MSMADKFLLGNIEWLADQSKTLLAEVSEWRARAIRLEKGVRWLAKLCDECECDGADESMTGCQGCCCEVLRLVLAPETDRAAAS